MAWYNPSTWTPVDNLQNSLNSTSFNTGTPTSSNPVGGFSSSSAGPTQDPGSQPFDFSGLVPVSNRSGWNYAPDEGNTGATGTGAYGAGGGGGGTSYNQQDVDMLNQQQTLYERLLQAIDAAEQNGLQDLNTSETQSRNKANLQRGRQVEDFNMKRDDFTRGQDKALTQVGDNSRTLRGSLMRRLGLASGGGSAFDVADTAVAKDASKNRAGIQENYGVNFRNLGQAEKRGGEDFASLLEEIAANRRSSEEKFRTGILGQRQGMQQSLAQIAADRAGVMGGNQLDAARPYMNNYMGYQDQIDRLPQQFNTQVAARDLNPQNVSLRDYIVERSSINGGTQKQYSPYSQFLRPRDDEEQTVA